MPKYEITYKLQGYGTLAISAKSPEDALHRARKANRTPRLHDWSSNYEPIAVLAEVEPAQ